LVGLARESSIIKIKTTPYGPTRPIRLWAEHGSSAPALQTSIFLGDLKRAVDLNAEVAYGAFDPRVAE
jgi:hypothetical protein